MTSRQCASHRTGPPGVIIITDQLGSVRISFVTWLIASDDAPAPPLDGSTIIAQGTVLDYLCVNDQEDRAYFEGPQIYRRIMRVERVFQVRATIIASEGVLSRWLTGTFSPRCSHPGCWSKACRCPQTSTTHTFIKQRPRFSTISTRSSLVGISGSIISRSSKRRSHR